MDIDAKTFENLYEEFAQKIYTYCYFRVSSKEEAEDIAAAVFFRAWDHVVAGKSIENVQAFLYRIASNLVIDHYRKNKDRREITLDDPQRPIEIPDSTDIAQLVDQGILADDMKRYLALLPDAYREVIVLKYINDLSVKEIAEVLHTSENNISVRLHRAIDKLKIILKP